MILTLDVGNSNTVIGGVSESKVKFVSRMATDRSLTEDQYAISFREILSLYGFSRNEFSGAVISSVVPQITNVLAKAVTKAVGLTPLIVGPGVKTGLNIKTDNPAQVGSDIIMNNVAAKKLYNSAVIVVDLGTATTISATDANGNFLGCAIMPGISVSLNALTNNTSQLQGVSLENPKKIIGTNTVESMKSGIIYGTACMLDGMIEKTAAELSDNATVVITGGHAEFIAPYCKQKLIHNENLQLLGLYMTYIMNNSMKG